MQKNVYQASRHSRLIKYITILGMLSALAYVLMLFDIPLLLLFPGYLKIDFSDLPALIASIFIHPLFGVIVEGIKNLLHFFTKADKFGIGELANFAVGVAFVLPAGAMFNYLSRKRKEKKSDLIVSLVFASLFMAIAGAFVNYYIMLPAYSKIMPLETIIGLSSSIFPFITTKLDVIIFSIIPFNLLKAVLISIVFIFIYKLLKNPINKFIK